MANYQPPPPPYGQPGYGQPAQDPGRTLGIVGLVLAIFCNLIGLVVSIIAFTRSKNAGFKNNIALAGIIVGAALFVISLIVNFTVMPTYFRQ